MLKQVIQQITQRFKAYFQNFYIRFYRNLRVIGISASAILIVIMTLTIYPLSNKITEIAEASLGEATASETTLTVSTEYNKASLDIAINSSDGTFATSPEENLAKFSVATNNYTGYTLTLAGSDDTRQLSSGSANGSNGSNGTATIDSISSAINAATFSTDSTYTNTWGYLPSKFNSIANTDYQPAPTTKDIHTLDITTTPNTTANDYTIGLGARIDYTKPTGTYTNTFVLTAVANDIAYSISYADTTGDGAVAGIPDTPTTGSIAGGTASVSSIAELSTNIPTRTGYTFAGWCLGTVTHTASANSTCSTDSIFPASTTETPSYFGIDQTVSNDVTLSALWEVEKYDLVVNFAGKGVESVKICTASGDCSGDDLIDTISTSGGSVSNLPFGASYYLYPTIRNYYDFVSWANTGSYGTISSLTEANSMFTVGAGDGAVAVTGDFIIPGYSELEYIQSGSGQYINTGITPSNYTYLNIKTKATLLSITDESFQAIFGIYDGGSGSYACGWYQPTGTSFRCNYGYNNTFAYQMGKTWAVGETNEFEIYATNGTPIYLNFADGSSYSWTTPAIAYPSLPLYLFAEDHISGLNWRSHIKMYHFQMSTTTGTLIDLVPCKNGTTVGMCDAVTKTFFGNSGSGSFTPGPEV